MSEARASGGRFYAVFGETADVVAPDHGHTRTVKFGDSPYSGETDVTIQIVDFEASSNPPDAASTSVTGEDPHRERVGTSMLITRGSDEVPVAGINALASLGL